MCEAVGESETTNRRGNFGKFLWYRLGNPGWLVDVRRLCLLVDIKKGRRYWCRIWHFWG